MGKKVTPRNHATNDHVRLASMLSVKCCAMAEPGLVSCTAASDLAPGSAPDLAPRPSRFGNRRPFGSRKLHTQNTYSRAYIPPAQPRLCPYAGFPVLQGGIGLCVPFFSSFFLSELTLKCDTVSRYFWPEVESFREAMDVGLELMEFQI